MPYFYCLKKSHVIYICFMVKDEFIDGIDRVLKVYEDRIELLPKGIMGIGTGNETFFIKDIVSVSVRECSFISSGYIQISVPGTKEENNRVIFGGFVNRSKMNANAQRVKSLILSLKSNLAKQ